ncbi:hypothetical protein MNBD_GAMMA10-1033 [hydrothermal vent metagenome]|uniref:Uncharacterized protein n=1 Tax=hydrothermal vent metagenome TaxID=652676 RepID=A0A3B0XLA2_9ZZZZ
MFWTFWKKKTKKVEKVEKTVSLYIHLNSRLTIDEAADTYQKPLKKNSPGIVINDGSSGGSATRMANNEILYAVVDVEAVDSSRKTLDVIIDKLNDIGVPVGSYIKEEAEDASHVSIGHLEGLIVYLTGGSNEDKAWEDIDVLNVSSQFKSELSNVARIFAVNEYVYGKEKTSVALSAYGVSYDEMLSEFDKNALSVPASYNVSWEKAPLEIVE